MRILLAIPLLLTAACNVEHDEANNQVVLNYDEEGVENTAEDVGNTAENVAADVGNAVEETAEDIGNEVDTNRQ